MVQGSGLASRSATAQTPSDNQVSQYLVSNIFFQVLRAEDPAQEMISSLMFIQFSLNKDRNVTQSAKTNITLSYGESLGFLFSLSVSFFLFFFWEESVSVSQEFKLL